MNISSKQIKWFDILKLLDTYVMNAAKLSYNIMKGTEYFVSLYMRVVVAKEYNVMVNGEELIGTSEYLML